MIDYKELLRKYLQHVLENEGVAFLHDCQRNMTEGITDEEWQALKRLAGVDE